MTDVEFDAFIKQDKRGGTYTIPEPFFVRDEVLGYSAREGLYRFIHSGKKKGRFVVNVTVLEDGSRATSYAGANLDAQRRIYIFGDSYIWGWGVNDQHTFAWLLQDKLGDDYRVYNFAQASHGNIHNYLKYRQILSQTRAGDILVFGYAPYYNERNVAAPRRIRGINGSVNRLEVNDKQDAVPLHPYGLVEDGKLAVKYVPIECDKNDGWCKKQDPSTEEMHAVTIAIFDEIIRSSRSHLAVASISPADADPVILHLQKRQVPIINLDLSADVSGYLQRDNNFSIDYHPGPVGHYYYFKKVYESLKDRGWLYRLDRR